MALFDFITNAGSKLGQTIYEVTHKDDPDPTAPVEPDPERIARRREASIRQNIEDSGVVVQDLAVDVEGENATLKGKVNTQECSEKLTLLAGNQHGIGTVDCQLEVANPAPQSTFYTVQSGDTLGAIAKAHYGDASQYMKIFEANREVLNDPNKIYPGQSLRIPE